jgi:uncharacterized cupredoxin-like copper-binding protein
MEEEAMRLMAIRAVAVVVVLSLAGILTACSSSPAASPTGTTVDVTLQEWAVVVGDDTVPAGEITFAVTNDGPDDIHEFVIIQTDLQPDELPTDEHGAVSEEGEGMQVIDEIEDIEVGDSQELTVELEAGSYVLLCNIYSADEDEAHYQEGMRTVLTVE